MNKHTVEFSRRANIQIHNIFSYIAEDNANAALRMVDKLEERIYQLEDVPFIGIELQKDEYPFLMPGYRKLIVKPFIVYYRVINQVVYVTHIVHSRRNHVNVH